MTKAWLIVLSILLPLISAGLGFSSKYYIPKVKPFIIKEIKKQTHEYIQLDLENENIGLNWLPLSLYINHLKVTPIKKAKNYISPFEVKNIQFNIDTFNLFKGNIKVNNIKINDSTINIIIKNFRPNNNKKKFTDFDFLKYIPVDKVSLHKVKLLLKVTPLKLSIQASEISATVENLKNALITSIETPQLLIKESQNNKKFHLSLETKFLTENERILISNFKAIHTDNSYLNLVGQISGNWLANEFRKININTSGQLLSQEAIEIVHAFAPSTKTLKTFGLVKFDINYDESSTGFKKPSFKLETNDFKIGKYYLGDVNLNAKIKDETLVIDQLYIKNKIAHIDKGSLSLGLTGRVPLTAELNIKKFSLYNLLSTLRSKKSNNLMLELAASGNADCQGQLRPKIKLSCKTKVTDGSFQLDNLKKEKNIIKIENTKANALVEISHKSISYDGQISINESLAEAKGLVDYQNGFFVDFDGKVNDAKNDIANLVGLNLEGHIDIVGTVKGDSKTASLTSIAECKDCKLKKWELGNFISDVSYMKGKLKFDNIIGIIGETSHKSNVNVNINKGTIRTHSNIPKFELKDVQFAIRNNVPIPFSLDSSGSATIQIWGPLELSKLNFDLNSKFAYGFVNKESFDEAFIKMNARTGHVKIDNFIIKKADSTLTLSGDLNPNGQLNLLGKVPSLQLQNSENFSALKTEIDGQMAIDAQLSGHILDPKLKINGALKSSSLGDKIHKDSKVQLVLDKESVRTNISLNKNQFTANIKYPFKRSDAHISMQAKNWNFSHILEGIFPHFKKFNLFTNFNGSTDLTIPNKDFSQTQGTLDINSFFILRGAYSVYLEKPLKINFSEGNFSNFNTHFKGQRTDLNIISKNSSFKNLDLNIKGQLDLGVGLIFSSFVEEFKGETSISMGIKGPFSNINMFGSIYIQNSILKLFGLSQPINDIQSEITVKNKTLFLNTLTGEFGGGKVITSGVVEFTKHLPKLNLKGRLTNSNFKSIDGVNLFLDGDISLSGKKLPYLLTAKTNIKKGKIDKVLNLDNEKNTKFKISEFAPKNAQPAKEKAIQLNIVANIDKPIPTKILTTQFQLQTNLEGQLKITNTPQKPILNGRVNLNDGGTILFRNNEYQLKTGYLTYENQPPSNPFLYLDAEGRIQDHDVSISVLGSGKEPKFNFQSSPSLPESEIINLVALGYTSTDIDNESGPQDQTEQLMFDAGSSIIKEKLGLARGMNDKLGIELDISSTYNDDQSKPIPVVTLKKKFGRKLEATASQTVEKKATKSFKLVYKLNRNLGVIGSYVQEEGVDTTNSDNNDSEALGLDFEYKLEFK